MSTRNMVAELPVVLEVLSDGWGNWFFWFWRRRRQFLLLAAAASTFRQGNQQSASTLFSPRRSSDGSTLEKHKYRPQNVIRFHLQGCICVLKRPPTLTTSKDTHCNDKRFGNLPPSFRSLAFFLRSITVKSLALYEWTNGTEIFGNSGKSGKKEIPRKVLPFFRKLSTGMKRSI